MKKWTAAILMVVFVAGISVADESSPWWKFGLGGSDKEQVETKKGPKHQKKGRTENRNEHRRSQLSDEQRAQMKARYQEVQKLAEAARSETDPVKKEELTSQLRAKLTEAEKKMQAQYRKRMEVAEQELAKMKERLDKRAASMEQRVEEKLQKILSGEKPERKGGSKGEHRRKDKKPVE